MPQDHLGEPRRYYEPSDQGVEKKIKERVDRWRALTEAARIHVVPAKDRPA